MKPIRINQKFTTINSESFKKYLNEISDIEVFGPEEEFECAVRASSGDKRAADELVRRNLRFVISIAKQYETSTIPLEDLVNEGNVGLIMAVKNYNPTTGFKFISYAVWWIRKYILEHIGKNVKMIRLPANKFNAMTKLNQHINDLEQKLGKEVDVSELIDEYGPEISNIEISELKNLSMYRFDSLDSPIDGDESTTTLGEVISDKNIQSTDYDVSLNYDRKVIDRLLDNLKPRDKGIMIRLFGLNGHEAMTLKEVSDEVGLTSEMVRQIRKKSLSKLKKCYS